MNRLRCFLYCSLLLLGTCLRASAQTDTAFWFAAPDVYQDIINAQNFDRPIRLYITAYATAATVTVSQPAGGGMPVQTISVPANGTQMIDLSAWLGVVETQPANTVVKYGLKIASTAPITVYYQVISQNQNSPEAFVLKGRNALGKDFWIPSQDFINNSIPRTGAFSSFEIIASENNTTITITPTNPIIGHAAGVTFNITLNQGETWSGTATGQLAAQHLGGSRVVSDKPIAITIKDDLIDGRPSYYGAIADLAGDQIVPVDLLGTEYIAVEGDLPAPGDQVFVLATKNGTSIARNGTSLTTINAGQTYRVPVNGISYIKTSQPVYALQLSGIGDFGESILPQLCSGSSSVSYVRLYTSTSIVLVVPNGGQGNFLLNGVAGVITSAQFTVVPGTSGQWYAAKIPLSTTQYPVGSVIKLTNNTALFSLGVLDALNTGSNGSNYGYFSNFRSIEAMAHSIKPSICAGDDIELVTDTVAGATYTWKGPNGFGSNQQNPVITPATIPDSGAYTVIVEANGCKAYDTVVVPVFAVPVVDLGLDTALCADTLMLQSSIAYKSPSYLWSTSETTPSIKVTQTGNYILQVTVNGCSSSDSINVNMNPSLFVNLGNDTVICVGDTIVLNSAQLASTTYLWSTGLTSPDIKVYQTGTYWLYAERNGCNSSDTVNVKAVQRPVISIGMDTIICESIPLRIGTGIPDVTYEWSTGSTDQYIQVAATGNYKLTVNREGCKFSDDINVTAMPDPDIELGEDRDICPEQIIVLDATDANSTIYKWNTGAVTPTINATKPGTYVVKVISEYGCVSTDAVTLKYFAIPTILLGDDTVVCEETPLRLIPVYTINEDILRWSTGSTDNQIDITQEGTYIVEAKNKCGSAYDTINIKQIFCDIWVPNAFTPNGDGLNDKFRVLGNIGRLEGFSLTLYNRWGQSVFTTTDKYDGWNGLFNGGEAMQDTYVYMLSYSLAGKPVLQKGNFHLIR